MGRMSLHTAFLYFRVKNGGEGMKAYLEKPAQSFRRCSGSFLAIPDIYLDKLSAEQTALAAKMIDALTNPEIDTSVSKNRGFIRTIARRCDSGSGTFRRVLHELYDLGYIRQIVAPYGTDKFAHAYTLLLEPEPLEWGRDAATGRTVNPYITHWTYKDIQRHNGRFPAGWTPLKEKYTAVPAAALRDERLSLAAQGLFAIIWRQLNIYNPQGKVIYKDDLYRASNLNVNKFLSAWRELVHIGYLEVVPVRGRGIKYHEFILHEDAGQTRRPSNIGYINPGAKAGERVRQTVVPGAVAGTVKPANPPAEKTDRKAIKEYIQQQVEYDFLIQNVLKPPLYYHKEDIDGYIQIIVDTVCATRPYWVIGGERIPADEVRSCFLNLTVDILVNTIQQVAEAAEQRKIKNPTAYKRSCLYNAAASTDV